MHRYIKEVSTPLLIVFGLLSVGTFVLCIAGGLVLNDFDHELQTIHATKDTAVASWTGMNSTELEDYIAHTNETLSTFMNYFYIFTSAFIFMIVLKIIFRIYTHYKK